jgi:hypothetical protein
MEFDEDRREFICSLGRYLLLGGLVSVTGGLILKRVLASDKECIETNICQSCKVFDNCDLPKALKYKH